MLASAPTGWVTTEQHRPGLEPAVPGGAERILERRRVEPTLEPFPGGAAVPARRAQSSLSPSTDSSSRNWTTGSRWPVEPAAEADELERRHRLEDVHLGYHHLRDRQDRAAAAGAVLVIGSGVCDHVVEPHRICLNHSS